MGYENAMEQRALKNKIEDKVNCSDKAWKKLMNKKKKIDAGKKLWGEVSIKKMENAEKEKQ